MKTYLGRIFFGIFMIGIIAPVQLDAACQIVGTTINGYIVVCDGPDTIGVNSGDGNDIITIETGADVSTTDQQSADSMATANAITVDAGSGNNQVTNNGSVGANAGANALPKVQTASQATANATGISAGDGADDIQNASTIASTATSNSESGNISLTLEGNTQFQSMTTSKATATGIDVGGGKNQVINMGVIATIATSEADASSINVDVGDSGGVDVRTIANAIAAGISGGNGEDEIITREGTITVNAAADVNNENALVTIDAAKESLVTGSSLSDASVTADASATGIDGGAGDDRIVNDETEISANANAVATAVGVSLMISGNLEGNIEGEALSDSSATALAKATGIDGGGGNDTIENRGKISANADSKATAIGVGVGITLSKEGSASGTALSDASVTASAAATGIDGGGDADVIDNQGDIELLANSGATGVSVALDLAGTMKGTAAGSSVSDSRTTAQAVVTGIAGGEGDDEVINDGLATTTNANVSATGVSVGLTVSGSMEGNVAGEALSDASVTANAAATGIDGGSGRDSIDNWSKLSSEVDASATGVAASLKVGFTKEGDVSPDAVAEGSALSDASVTASAAATGIDGGEGSDEIGNRGDIELLANSGATGVSVSVDVGGTMKGGAAGSSVSDSRTTAQASATGIDGGEGDDTIDNEGTITLMKQGEGEGQTDASATAVSVGLTVTGSMEGNVEGRALSDASALADAATIGISGGAGIDAITNRGAIVAEVDSKATAVGVSVGITVAKEGSASGAALSDASVTASAAATGIDGGEGSDEIGNRGDIELLANSEATGVSVSVDVAGTMKGSVAGSSVSDSRTTAQASGTGITGGAGDDSIINDGFATTTNANASATGVSVGLTVSGSMEGNTEGKALSDASVTANAAATGIDGGSGQDTIDNWSKLSSEVDASATGVAASLKVGFSKEGDVAPDAVAEGSSLSDASVTAKAAATGIDGGENGDTIDNRGDIELLANSGAMGVSVALDVAGTMKGSAAGSSVSDASVTAETSATGIDGGDGDDTIANEGAITLMSTEGDASATAVSVGLTVSGSLEGNVEGKALSDASALADASATGIRGGLGVDKITNRGAIAANVDSSATAVGVGLDVSLSLKEGGNASGAALSDASVTAKAAATGIEGGGDADVIDNRGAIGLIADAGATGVSASLAIAGSATFKGKATGDVAGEAVSDTSVMSAASVTGIDGGEGDDVITNQGDLNLFWAKSDATGVAASLNMSATGSLKGDSEGNAAGEALSDASVTAMAAAVAIDGKAGNDTIENKRDFGAIVAESGATGVAASLDIAGSVAFKGGVKGEVEGKALSESSTTAYAEATGIDGGEDKDIIVNEGNFNLLQAKSGATGVAASLNVATGLAIQGDAKVDVSGAAVSDARVTAQATTTAIEGAGGDDEINNTGDLVKLEADSGATGVAASLDIAGSLAFKGETEGNISGAALSDTSVTAEAFAMGLDAGDGHDTIINEGDIVSLLAKSDATGVAASLSTTTGLSFKGDANVNASGEAVSKAAVTANSMATGIEAGAGDDKIINTGNIVRIEANSTATGVAAGLDFTSVLAIKGNSQADVTGEAVGDSRVIAQAAALGIDGGLGDDTIDNEGDMRLLSTADATGVTAELNVSASLNFKGFSMADVSGTAASNSSVSAKAEATGIDGGWGQDTIRNSGDITLMNEDVFDADALGVSASLNVSGNVAIKGAAAGTVKGAAASNATVTAEAAATGIDGGGNNDIIDNTGAIKLLPSSNAEGIAVSLNVSGNMVGETEGSAMSDASVTAKSTATGIDGGEGDDTIINKGAITLMKQEAGEDEVDAEALGVAASLDVTGNLNGTAEGQALSKATTTADARAIGISGAGGVDTITNTGDITADVDSDAEGVSIAAEVSVAFNGTAEGSSLSDASTTAKAKAAGIEAGEDDDIIDNSGVIQLFSDAEATSTAVSLTVSGALRGQAGGEALSKATTTADATATGIDGGEGLDEITNLGLISANASATTDAVAVAGSLSFTLAGTAQGAALSDLSSTSFAGAMGIDGGGGDDTIDNEGAINVSSLADAQATAVSVGLTGAMKGLAEGKSVADSSAEAIAQSIGIDGGEGNDRISSSANPITAFAQSLSDAESVSVQGTGAVGMAKGAAVADSSASSVSYSAGIDGGLGNDTIENASEIKSTAKADAEATSTTVGVTIGLGAAETIGTGDSSATAKANSTGIEGGEGNDRITNMAKITTGGLETTGPMASAQAGATSVTVGIAAGLNMSEASSNAAAIAEVNTAGISGGSGDDWIYNTGDIAVGPDPMGTGSMASASAKSTTVKVDVTLGASLGKSSSDTSSTAVVNLAGIGGGSGNDTVYNSGSITVGRYFSDSAKPGDAMATANAGSETVNVGLTVGGSFSDASSNASATAHSKATGIETGLGADVVNNTGVINTFSSSEALGTAEAIKVALTIGALEGAVESDASTLSTALATGIDSGEDADEIDTDGDFVVKALSTSTTTSKAEDLNVLSIGSAIQSATANSSSTAEAFARGIDGGTGADTITAAGNYEVSADTEVFSTSRSSTVTGFSGGENKQKAQALAGTTAQALAVGIDGGEGNDVINSSATLMVNTLSNASTTGVSAANTGFNIAGSSSGESVAGATSDVTATGIGIRGGMSVLAVNESDADVIINEGMISVTTTVSAKTESISTADSITFIGAAEGTAVSDASASVLAEGIGIDGGADNDTITSKNTIAVKTTADASVTSTSNVDSYATFGGASSMGVSDASANVLAEATGISGGTGDDIITSLGPVTVEAESIGSVTAKSYVNAKVTFGGASSKAASDASVTKKATARGIDGGDGDDVIANYDTLNVRAISAGTVTSESRARAGATFGSSSSMTTTAAALEGAVDAVGIIGGSGDDWIKNLGNVNSTAHAELTVKSVSVATAKSTFGSSDARAFSVSTAQGKASSIGISGDDGKDLIENEGVVNASAIANTNVKSATVAIARSTFGSEFTVAASSNYAAGESTSKGITAGAGDDTIVNKGLVTVESGGTVKVDSLTVSSDGPAYSDAGTLALACAKGVDGGDGQDGILNTDTVFVKAAPSISSATRTFGSGGNVDGKVGILLNGTATGITGGEGNDAITNEGNVLVFVGGSETESTVSENAVSGSTTITDKSFATSADPKELVGKWIRITGGENPDFFTQVVAFDPQTGTFTLRDPLKYDLPKNATYALYDYGQKTPDITSLNVTVGGRTRVDASTTASVQAKGIVGGDGDDHIVNAGTTAVSASNLVKTVTLSLTRNIRADTRIESNVNAVGIEGNDQSSVTDVSDGETNVFTDLSQKGVNPESIVGKPVLFKSGSSADFATLVKSFDPDTGTFTLADPLPSGGLMRGDIYTLGGGSDSITNQGAITVEADSAINASSWSLSYRSADIEVKGQAQVLSTGMRGGEFDDSFQNLGPIVTRSTADVSSTERVMVKFGGGAEQKLSFEASSNSVGVDAGAGNDKFTNVKNSSIDAEAVSTANVQGVTTTYENPLHPSSSYTINLTDAIAQSTAVGIDLGAGRDVTSSEGEFKVSANAVVTAKAISDFDLWDETDADADAIAKASAWGIKAGSGGDQVLNRNLIQVDASADATSFAQGAKVGNKDDTSTVTKDSSARSKEFVDASLQGQDPQYFFGKWVRFLTGENEDFFTRIMGFDPSTGTITIFDELPGDLKAADLYTFSAARNGTSASVASAIATGIDVGEGNAAVENTGVIRVKAFAKADTTAKAFAGQTTAQANSSSEARGIRTGSGDDVIRNAGVIDVESEVVTTTSGGSATEIATATGIDAGDGNNKIANEGQINVTASVAQPNGEAKAQGIITGEGDDIIINSGKIISSIVINGTRELGIGIKTGGGSDHVTLAQGTLVEGSINLGEGNDTLVFTGSPMVSGEVTGESGTDALMFEGAGSIGFTPMAFENTIKQSAGTFTVANLPTMQRIEIKEGALVVNNNYPFSNSGFFQTIVNGDGSFGQFKVNGTTELAGDLSVLKGPGPFLDGTTYDIIEADVVNGAFSNITLPDPNNFVSFEMNQFPTLVQIEVYARDFTWLARNRVEWAVANYLDRILPSATGDLLGILAQIQSLSQSEFFTALSTLSSDSYDNFTRTTFSTTQQYSKSLQHRMNNLRHYQFAHLSDDQKPILLAFRGSDASLGQLFSPGGLSQVQGKNGLWFDAFGQWGDQDEENGYHWNGGYTGYDYFLRGATLGFDHALSDKLMAGVSVGYSRADIDLSNHQGSGYIKSLIGAIYGSYFNKNLYVDGALSYGRNWYDNHRLITIGTDQQKAYSNHDGDLFSAYLGAGYTFDIKRWLIGPFGTLQYTYLDEESFKEKGAGGVSLRIDDRQTDSLVSELGLRLTRFFKIKYGSLVPEVSAAWLHDFDIDDRVITSSFAGSPGASFSIKGEDVEKNGATVGTGITFIHQGGLSTSLKYKGEFREKYTSHGIMGELRFTF